MGHVAILRSIIGTTPPGFIREKIRGIAFGVFGSPRIHPRICLPRKPMLVDPGDTAVMVGTPNDNRIPQFLKLVGDAGELLIIEPSPNSLERLRETASKYSNVHVDGRAAGSQRGTRQMPIAIDSSGREQVIPKDHPTVREQSSGSISAKIETLDTIIEEYGVEPDYIEIMVNGAEYDVLSGATELLEKARPRLLVKSYGFNTDEEIDDASIQSLLKKYGYAIVRSPYRKNPPSPGSPDGDLFAYSTR